MILEIVNIEILLTDSTDKVFVYTDMSSPFPNWLLDYELKMSFECARNYGVQYVRENFNIEPKVTNIRVDKK